VPVIATLAKRLAMYRECCGSPLEGPMFANPRGGRLNLNNRLSRVTLPALNRCRHCGGIEGKSPSGELTRTNTRREFLRGMSGMRRGVGTNLYHLGVPDKVIQRILRHSNVVPSRSWSKTSQKRPVLKPFGTAMGQ
jgi:hypothetical protein